MPKKSKVWRKKRAQPGASMCLIWCFWNYNIIRISIHSFIFFFQFKGSLSEELDKNRDTFNNSGNVNDKPMTTGEELPRVPFWPQYWHFTSHLTQKYKVMITCYDSNIINIYIKNDLSFFFQILQISSGLIIRSVWPLVTNQQKVVRDLLIKLQIMPLSNYLLLYSLLKYKSVCVCAFFCLECIIKNIKCSEKPTEMESTYGAWMSDASQLDEDQYWVADHFSGDLHNIHEFSLHNRLLRVIWLDLTQELFVTRSTFVGISGPFNIAIH